MVLSFQQYKQRHAKRLAGKTNGQIAASYKAYVNQQARSVQKPAPKKKGAPKSRAVGKALAETAASFLPGPLKVLSPLAGEVGGFLGEGIGTLLGLGDYTVKKNSIVSEGNSPAYMHSKKGSVFVRHREFITNVYSSSAAGSFKVQNFPIQPGLTTSMPWLSLLTKGFQEWQPHGIVYEFKSNTGMISSAATPSIGMVVMATDYDSFDTNPFVNKVDMENTQYTTNAKATESFYHPVECAYNKNILDRLFLRSNAVPEGQPPQFYDLGTFAIASVGTPVAGQNLGELWVTYDIELMKPTMKNHDSTAILEDIFWTGTTQPVRHLWSGYQAGYNNTLGGDCYAVDANTNAGYRFPVNLNTGSYVVQWLVETGSVVAMSGTSPAITCTNCIFADLPWINTTGGTLQPIFGSGDYSVYGAPFPGESSERATWTFRVDITAAGASFEIDATSTTWVPNQIAGIFMVNKINREQTINPSTLARSNRALYPQLRDRESVQREAIAKARGETKPDQRDDMIKLLKEQLDSLDRTGGSHTQH